VTVLLEDIVTTFENPFQGFQKARIVVPVAQLIGIVVFIVHDIEIWRRSHDQING
jgi:hypothetical protein